MFDAVSIDYRQELLWTVAATVARENANSTRSPLKSSSAESTKSFRELLSYQKPLKAPPFKNPAAPPADEHYQPSATFKASLYVDSVVQQVFNNLFFYFFTFYRRTIRRNRYF